MPRPSNQFSGGSSRKRKPTAKSAPRRGGNAGLGRLFLGIGIGAVLTAAAVPAYFYFGNPPVAVSDKPGLWEHLSQRTAVDRRIQHEAKTAPFTASEDVFEAAARTYRSQCAQCHGTPAQDAAVGAAMVPRAQQFFTRDRKATAAKSAGELYWPTAFGIRRSGMPAYRKSLTNTQLWQLAILLHSADQDLPDPVRNLLAPVIPATSPTNAPPGTSRVIQLNPEH